MTISTQSEYAAAVNTIRAASAAYYADGSSTLTDAEYDALLSDAGRYETEHGITDGVSTQVAAGAVTAGDVAHSVPMLSLDNVFDETALTAFINRVGVDLFAVEPKLDGLAVAIHFEDGHPVRMLTRGDGRAGEDVSYALPTIENLPELACGSSVYSGRGGLATRDIVTFTGEVRGEVIFTREQYAQANKLRAEHNDRPFATARNGAAGTLRGAKGRDYVIPLSFFAYDVISGAGQHSHVDRMLWLSGRGFETSLDVFGHVEDDPYGACVESDVRRIVSDLADAATRAQMPVETDGLVIKADLSADRDSIGEGSRAPRWAVAYKFPAEQATTKLVDFDMEVGRTGVITPRAILEPVFVGGTTITYATLHNFEDVARKDIQIGDTVVVVRAGEVIPRVESVILANRDGSQTPIVAPAVCPRCSGPLDTSQARLRCAAGRGCGVAASISYAVSRDALDIEGLGPKQVAALVVSETFIDVASIFETGLSENLLVTGGGVAKANAPKIVAQIVKAKDADLSRVITALGIKGTGRSMSRRLAKHFGTMAALRSATLAELAAVDGIGEAKAALIHTELADLSDVIDRLAAAGVNMGAAAAQTDSVPATADGAPLAGMSVCVTGTMVSRSRNEMNELVETLGGRAASSVSKSTTILVAGPGAGSKLAKANSLGVRVMSEDEFLAEFGGR